METSTDLWTVEVGGLHRPTHIWNNCNKTRDVLLAIFRRPRLHMTLFLLLCRFLNVPSAQIPIHRICGLWIWAISECIHLIGSPRIPACTHSLTLQPKRGYNYLDTTRLRYDRKRTFLRNIILRYLAVTCDVCVASSSRYDTSGTVCRTINKK